MNTTKKNKSLLSAIIAIALMIGGGFLLSLTINDLYGSLSAFATLSFALSAVFIYVAGTTLMGYSLRKGKHARGGGVKASNSSDNGERIVVFYSHEGVDSGVLLAFLLIAAGALLFCFNAQLLNPAWKSFLFSWPMLFFAIGAICLCKRQLIAGFIAVAGSVFFLIGKAAVIFPHDIQVDRLMSNFWPAVFVVSGIVIILSFFIRPKVCKRKHSKGNWIEEYSASESENSDGRINYRFVCSGTEQVILDPVFKGGSIDVTLGGLDLDLRRTSLAEGTTTLHVNAVLGGVEIKAPDTWDIEIVSKSFAGGVADSRAKYTDVDHSRKLVVYARCTLGGITIE